MRGWEEELDKNILKARKYLAFSIKFLNMGLPIVAASSDQKYHL